MMHDKNAFVNDKITQPTWNPQLEPHHFAQDFTVRQLGPCWIIDGLITSAGCKSLREDVDAQELYPVGVDGYVELLSNLSGQKLTDDNVGSYRAMAWSPLLVDRLGVRLGDVLPSIIHNHNGGELSCPNFSDVWCPFDSRFEPEYKYLGPTPWLRFMRYKDGGMHVPHYDASFCSAAQEYRTLFSFVIYLSNASVEQGGEFTFVNDAASEHRLHHTDWKRMAERDEKSLSIQPVEGRILVFPHWFCHQVDRFTGNDTNPHRYIVRGDIAYGF